MTNALRRPAAWLGAVVLLIELAAGLFLVAPALLGYDRYVITGGSMTGTINKYSIVFEREVPVGGLEVGDIITYLPPADSGTDSLVTHRIISIGTSPDGLRVLRTQGDANPDPDPWKFELVQPTVNTVAWHVPYAGWPLIALADPHVRRLVIGLPALAVALFAAWELVGAVRRSRAGDETDAPLPQIVA